MWDNIYVCDGVILCEGGAIVRLKKPMRECVDTVFMYYPRDIGLTFVVGKKYLLQTVPVSEVKP